MGWWQRLFGQSEASEKSDDRLAIVQRQSGGAIVLVRGSMVDTISGAMASHGTSLGTEENAAMIAARFAGMSTENGLLLYKQGNAEVRRLASGTDALSGADSSWDEPCYLVMFRGC